MWSLFAALLVFIVLPVSILFFFYRRQYRQAGNRLLVIPLSKSKRFTYIALSAALLVIGMAIIWLDTDDNSSLYSAIGGGIIGCSTTFWMQLLFPIELREHGVIIFGTLIWSKVKSYQWQNPRSLVLKYKPALGWQRKQEIKVSPLKQDLIEKILQSKLSNFKSYGTSQ